MPSDLFSERIRQLGAIDRNAFDIYSDLARRVEDPALAALFGRLAKQEAHHMSVEKEILILLNNPQPPATPS